MACRLCLGRGHYAPPLPECPTCQRFGSACCDEHEVTLVACPGCFADCSVCDGWRSVPRGRHGNAQGDCDQCGVHHACAGCGEPIAPGHERTRVADDERYCDRAACTARETGAFMAAKPPRSTVAWLETRHEDAALTGKL